MLRGDHQFRARTHAQLDDVRDERMQIVFISLSHDTLQAALDGLALLRNKAGLAERALRDALAAKPSRGS